MLARLDVDPGREAAALVEPPGDVAARRSSSLLSTLPGDCPVKEDAVACKTRLYTRLGSRLGGKAWSEISTRGEARIKLNNAFAHIHESFSTENAPHTQFSFSKIRIFSPSALRSEGTCMAEPKQFGVACEPASARAPSPPQQMGALSV
jgi:hypothetical protein